MSKPYIINDANGNPINAKYPPNREKYGDLYEGYKTWAEEVLFHRFGVLCYDVCFTYKNKEYFLLKEQNSLSMRECALPVWETEFLIFPMGYRNI